MTTKRTGRYGEIPGSNPEGKASTRAPLPLVTQPMVPIDDAGSTHVDATLPMRQESAAVLFSKPTVMQPAQQKHSPAGPPPEVGLTQHHLPEGEDLDPRLVMVSDPDSELAASFRVLRHHLLELGRPQVIVVSSALHGDGKTTTAVNLALALAECGRSKVLLAEAHLRRPQIGAAVKLVPPWCFAEQLAAHRNQPMLPWSLVEIPQLWLHVAAVNPRIRDRDGATADGLRPRRDRRAAGARLRRRESDGRCRRCGRARGACEAHDDAPGSQGDRSGRRVKSNRYSTLPVVAADRTPPAACRECRRASRRRIRAASRSA
jgi:hypothetical protein